jgi:hypothetical protein
MINAYWAFCGMKSRVAESDYEQLGVRFAGGVFVVFAIFVLIRIIIRWSVIWN